MTPTLVFPGITKTPSESSTIFVEKFSIFHSKLWEISLKKSKTTSSNLFQTNQEFSKSISL